MLSRLSAPLPLVLDLVIPYNPMGFIFNPPGGKSVYNVDQLRRAGVVFGYDVSMGGGSLVTVGSDK